MARRRVARLAVLVASLVVAWVAFRRWSTVPLDRDDPAFAKFAPPRTDAPAPIEVTALELGSTIAPKCVPAGQASCFATTTIVHAAYLVRHPKGTFLIDSGVHAHDSDDLNRFPLWIHLAFYFQQQRGLREALAAAGNPKLDFVLLTHAHWDHTSGLTELDHPKVVMGPGEQQFIANFPKNEPPSVMPEHLKNATVTSFTWDGPAYENFPASHDLFGDGSVVLVPLPGHTAGSLGVFLNAVHGRRLFFVGDAAWSRDAISIPSRKLRPFAQLVDADWATESETMWRLHHLQEHEPQLVFVPAHDGAALAEVGALSGAK